MLLSFSIGNFKSYKDVKTINLIATPDTEYEDNNVANIILPRGKTGKKVRVLKSLVLYGANASGKSNFLDAFKFVKYFIENSSKNMQLNEPIAIDRFRLDKKLAERPSYFEIQFIQDKIPFRYGFELTPKEVVSEWLFYSPKGKETRLFTRENREFNLGSQFLEGKKLEDKTRKNALFLSVCAQFNGKFSQSVFDWLKGCNSISGVKDVSHPRFTIDKLDDDKYFKKIRDFLKVADLGIADIFYEKKVSVRVFEKLPDEVKKILKDKIPSNLLDLKDREYETVSNKFGFLHKTIDGEVVKFNLSDESQGTQKIFAMAGPIIDTLRYGRVLFIDEFDTSLHPAITQFLISLFNSKDKNPNNAQLIFATHDINLLSNSCFRRDQILFTEKNKMNESDIFPLSDFKIRKDASFSKDYIQGKYGAVPYIRQSLFNIKDVYDE